MTISSLEPALSDVSASSFCHALPQAAVTALWQGRITEAVNLVRLEQHIGPTEAKGQIHAYLQTQPALRKRLLQAQIDTREGLLRWLIFLFVGAAGLLYLLT